MKYDIETIDELIVSLGGGTKVARELGISQPAVSAMKRRGIPGGWHMRLYAWALRLGKTVNPETVFGIPEAEFAPLMPSRPFEMAATA